ncbi:MAG: 16S rRNA (guanine(966)-N(2))-methyltransferase RsmD [Terriglobales bacterium]
MRVIAGRFKSRSIRSLPGDATRPTSDKLRETLFNVLTAGNPDALVGSVWLDLFAGTGAVGIEALSRGAGNVTFVDKNKAAVRVIGENLRSLGIREHTTTIDQDVGRALRDLDAKGFRADYVFIDPPYALQEAYEDALRFLNQSAIAGPSSLVIAEHDKREDPGEAFGQLRRYRVLEQGDSKLSFYRKT